MNHRQSINVRLIRLGLLLPLLATGWLVAGEVVDDESDDMPAAPVDSTADAAGGSPEDSDDGNEPENLVELNGTLFFTAYDGTYGWELWRSLRVSPGPPSTSGSVRNTPGASWKNTVMFRRSSCLSQSLSHATWRA